MKKKKKEHGEDEYKKKDHEEQESAHHLTLSLSSSPLRDTHNGCLPPAPTPHPRPTADTHPTVHIKGVPTLTQRHITHTLVSFMAVSFFMKLLEGLETDTFFKMVRQRRPIPFLIECLGTANTFTTSGIMDHSLLFQQPFLSLHPQNTCKQVSIKHRAPPFTLN